MKDYSSFGLKATLKVYITLGLT